MKKKNQIATLLDDLRHEDPKKRFSSVQQLKEIGTALGPARARTEFIQFLAEFVDDEQYIVLELLNQLSDFAPVLGGQQHEKTLLPLLIGFCKTDEKKQAEKAGQIIQSILVKNKDLITDVVKKLSKTDMSTARQTSVMLISSLINLIPQFESQLLEIYGGMIFSDQPTYRIIGARYLPKLLENVKNKQEIGKLLELVYNDADDLPKIFALEALVGYYSVSPNLVLTKFKALLVVNNWRINIKICQVVSQAAKVFSKTHLKSTFEASLLKFLDSPESELRAKACSVLKFLASIMTEEDIRKSLIPAVKRLSNDTVDYVKQEMSENVVGMIEVCSASLINDEILPIIFSFIKSNELALGIIKNFESMTKKLTSDVIEQKILGPLTSQFTTDNWRTKCRMIELLGNVINNSLFLNDKMTNMIMSLVCDKINAVKQKATELLINIIIQQSPQWCDTTIIPKLSQLKESQNYIERQVLLQIIEKTADKVSQKTLNDLYRSVVMMGLTDKVSNVRAKALKAIKGNKRLYDKVFDKHLERLKNDVDGQVKDLAQNMVKV